MSRTLAPLGPDPRPARSLPLLALAAVALLGGALASPVPAAPASADGVWAGMDPLPSPSRLTHSAVYDPSRHRMVVFGGSDGGYRNDTWVLELGAQAAWRQLPTTGAPPPARRLQSAIYDPIRDRMIVFGGFDDSYLNDVWELRFSGAPTWHRIDPAGAAPAPRAGHAAIYDPTGDRMIVFAGHDGVPPDLRVNDVWALSLSGPPAWTQLAPQGTPPAPRSSHTAIYDPPHQRMIVFGGTTPSYSNEVWALSLTGTPAWTQLAPSGVLPMPRESHSAVYDSARERMLICGGDNGSYYLDDTWALDLAGAPVWTHLDTGGTTPGERWGHTAVYDPLADRMVVYGGWGAGYRDDTRFLDLAGAPRWAPLLPALMNHSAIYDPLRQRMVVFGGLYGTYRAETWTIGLESGAIWVELPAAGDQPPRRRLHSAIYDPVRDRMIIYGGFDDTYRNDVWALALDGTATWTRLIPAGIPPVPRAGHTAIYDPQGDRMLIFGGHDGASPTLRRNDVWELSLSGAPVWTELQPAGPLPPPRSSHSMVLDEPRHRAIVFGGTAPDYLNDVWALALDGAPTWTELTPAGLAPVARESHSAIYDPVRQRAVVFGGDDGVTYHNDVWALSLAGAVHWTALQPSGPMPDPTWGHTAVYDAASLRMVVFGGFSWHITGEIWTLTWEEPVPVELAHFEVTSRDGGVVLSWRTAREVDHAGFDVLRAEDGTQAFARVNDGLIREAAPGSHTYAFADHAVVPGRRYTYRLEAVALDGSRQTMATRTVRVLPATPGTPLLLANTPNPFNPSTNPSTGITFDLDAPSAVVLQVYDVQGRLLRTLLRERLDAAEHVVAWDGRDDTGRALPSGIYIARVEAGGRSIANKMVLAR